MGAKGKKKGRRIASKEPAVRPVALSLCVIARDEADFLDQCLRSVRGLVDEIVVVDTGSADATPQVARRHGARVFRHPWQEDFAAARNRSLAEARGAWILVLDCDEAIAGADHAAIRQAMAREGTEAFRLTTRNYTAESNRAGWTACRGEYPEEKGYPGWFPTTKVRLWRRRPEIRFEGAVHELVEPALMRSGGQIGDCQVPVHHYGYVEKRRFREQYVEAGERKVRDQPGDLRARYELAIAYRNAGRLPEARESIETVLAGLAGAAPAARIYLPEEFALLVHADILARLGRVEEALEGYARILERFPDSFQAWNNRGSLLEGQGKGEEARRCYARGLAIAPDNRTLADNLARLSRLSGGSGSPSGGLISRKERGGEERLSLCMIVRDEEERLGRCLESVQGLVHEIVVVDTGSTDRTVEVARRYGARLGHFAWCDDFAAARNESLRLATGDWILWLDADDLLPAEEHAKIRQLIGQGRNKSYFFVLDDQGYEHVSCLQLRLFPRLSGVEFEMPIHEQVTPSLARLKVEMVATEIRVVHTGYTTPEVVRAKKERYLGIMERWLETHPENYIVRSHVALTYHSTGRLDEAVEEYRKILFASTCRADRNYVVYTTALLFLGRTYLKKGDLEQALEFVRQAEEVDPDYILTKLSLAEVQVRREAFAEALRYARAVLDGGRQLTFFPIDYPEVVYAAEVLCGRAYQGLEEFAAAEQAFRRAAEVPVARRSEALGSLSELRQRRGDLSGALQALQEASQLDPDSIQHLFNIGNLHLQQRELDRAAEYFAKVVARAPDFAPALLNLGYIAKAKGQLDEAERIYRETIEHDAEGVEGRANLGHLLLDRERFGEAGALFAEVRQRRRGLLDIELGLLAALSQQRAWLQVKDLLEEILALFPEVEGRLEDPSEAGRTLVRLGAVLVRRQLTRCAELAFLGAVFLDGGFTEARRGLAELHFAQGALWKAIAQYEAVLMANPRDRAAFRRLGDCYQRLGVDEAARQCYAREQQLAGS